MSNQYLSPLAFTGVGFVFHDGRTKVSEEELIAAHPEIPVARTLRQLRLALAKVRCAEHGLFPTVHVYFTKRRSQLELEFQGCCTSHEDNVLNLCARHFPDAVMTLPASGSCQLKVVAG